MLMQIFCPISIENQFSYARIMPIALAHLLQHCKPHANALVNLLPKRGKRICKNRAKRFVNLLPKVGTKLAYACKSYANIIGMKIAVAKTKAGFCRAKD